jgi:putative transposase
LRLPKGVTVPVVWSRPLPSEPSSVRVYRDSLGHWYASFVVTRETGPAPDAAGSIGIDWGVTTTATTTDPAYDLPYGGHRKRCAAELAKAQRRMARRRRQRGQAQSGGCRRAKRDAAKLHKKAQRQNTHAARVWARRVVDNHQTIAVEDFRPLVPGQVHDGTQSRRRRGRCGETGTDRAWRAGGPEGGAGTARLHHHDVR